MRKENPIPNSNEQKPTIPLKAQLYDSENKYYYEEGTIFGEEAEEGLKIWGEGEELERVKRYLLRHEIPSRYRLIFDFNKVYPGNKGEPSLSDKGQWRGCGTEAIRGYFRRRARNFEEVPTRIKYDFSFNNEYVSSQRIYDLLSSRGQLLREAGIDVFLSPTDKPLMFKTVWRPDGTYEYTDELPINMARIEVERLAKELDERKRKEDEEWE